MPGSEVWADDGTTWDNPEVVLSDGPVSVVLDPADHALTACLPRSGRVGFTATPGWVDSSRDVTRERA